MTQTHSSHHSEQPTTHPSSPAIANGPGKVRVDVTEREAWTMNGFLALALCLIMGLAAVGVPFATRGALWALALGALLAVGALALLTGLFMLSPGDTKVVQFFGRYVGTVRQTGLVCAAPLTVRKVVSVKVNNFETNELKVNDSDGNPINIAAIVVWQVADTAKATFAVEKYRDFVRVQSESALRHVAMTHPYDASDDVVSLRGDTGTVSKDLATEVAERVSIAGIEVVEVRIASLAYAPEIAQVMLQRQQASAVIAARSKIVEGAVGMVENALARLEKESIVELDDERKAAMVSNLLVVLCSDRSASPVINAGSLH